MKRTVPRLEGAARALGRGELIGLRVQVVASTDVGLLGFSGTVVDETLQTFVIERPDGRESRISKVGNTFEFVTAKGLVRVDGAAIEFRPEDRTKKVR
jgi:RNase P/RNase MRP subunit p29